MFTFLDQWRAEIIGISWESARILWSFEWSLFNGETSSISDGTSGWFYHVLAVKKCWGTCALSNPTQSHDFPMLAAWFSHELPFPHDFPTIFPWFSHQILWISLFPWVSPMISHEFPLMDGHIATEPRRVRFPSVPRYGRAPLVDLPNFNLSGHLEILRKVIAARRWCKMCKEYGAVFLHFGRFHGIDGQCMVSQWWIDAQMVTSGNYTT